MFIIRSLRSWLLQWFCGRCDTHPKCQEDALFEYAEAKSKVYLAHWKSGKNSFPSYSGLKGKKNLVDIGRSPSRIQVEEEGKSNLLVGSLSHRQSLVGIPSSRQSVVGPGFVQCEEFIFRPDTRKVTGSIIVPPETTGPGMLQETLIENSLYLKQFGTHQVFNNIDGSPRRKALQIISSMPKKARESSKRPTLGAEPTMSVNIRSITPDTRREKTEIKRTEDFSPARYSGKTGRKLSRSPREGEEVSVHVKFMDDVAGENADDAEENADLGNKLDGMHQFNFMLHKNVMSPRVKISKGR